MCALAVRGRVLGSRRVLFADFSVPLPPPDPDEGGMTLRRLIERIVRQQVAAFQDRQNQRQFIRALSAREIGQGVERGKIDMGGNDTTPQTDTGPQAIDEEEAVAVACQAFQDGMYLVVVDEVDIRELDREVQIGPDSTVTFIRLAMLAGG